MKLFDGAGLTAVAALTATAVVSLSPQDVQLSYTLDPDTIADYGDGFGEEGIGVFEEALAQFFGPHDEPRLPEDADMEGLGIASLEELQLGRMEYIAKCLHCHGASGGGDGTTAPFLNPSPRNFRHGKIKFTSTERAAPPTRGDIRKVLRRGVAYTAMPSFAAESDEDIEALVSYVQLLLMRGETERIAAYTMDDEGILEDEEYTREEKLEETLSYMQDEYDAIEEKWLQVVAAENEPGSDEVIVMPSNPRPAYSPESIDRGRELFLSATTECSACHGEDGRGRGPNVYNAETGEFLLTDDWGRAVQPADLTRGIYRGGDRPLDLYRRMHQGIKGTPMPQFAGPLSEEQMWDLVNYVYSLRYITPASETQGQ